MQPPCAVPVEKVGGVEFGGFGQNGCGMRIRRPGDLDASGSGRKAHLPREYPMGAGVVADAAVLRAGAMDLAALGLQRKGGGERFGGLDSGRADELRRHARVLLPELVVGGFVKLDAVLHPLFPPVRRDSVEAVADHGKGFGEHRDLVAGRVKLKPNRTFHDSYMY